MARNTATSQKITASNNIGGTMFPWTQHAHAKAPNTTTEGYAISQAQLTAIDIGITVGFRGDVGGDPATLRVGNNPGGVTKGVNSVASYSSGVWYALGTAIGSTTDYDLWFNGVRADGSTAVFDPSTTNHFILGAYVSSSAYSGYLNGDLAMAALWNAKLTDDEMNSLHKGFPPRRVRPQSLIFYAPLVRNVFDWGKNVLALTDTGTAASAHPRAYGF